MKKIIIDHIVKKYNLIDNFKKRYKHNRHF